MGVTRSNESKAEILEKIQVYDVYYQFCQNILSKDIKVAKEIAEKLYDDIADNYSGLNYDIYDIAKELYDALIVMETQLKVLGNNIKHNRAHEEDKLKRGWYSENNRV